MKKKSFNDISAELLAAFLDGNATAQESRDVIGMLQEDAELRELLSISQLVDSDLGLKPNECEFIPMTAIAANCEESNYCSLECEKYILKKREIEFDERRLLDNAIRNGWQKENGTALHNVGRHLEEKGFVVRRQYKCTIDDIANALNANEDVIVAVDGGELLGDRLSEIREDIIIGPIPDHTVVVLSYDAKKQTISIFDPNSPNSEDEYPYEQFADAWADSKNYLVTVNLKDMKTYIPKPIDVSDVKLDKDLTELREAIAENAHEIWAENRQKEGWTYGPQRNDELKLHPDMIPYSQLPEGEKDYDREMAMQTLKLIQKLGYDIVKREDTELYKELLKRIRDVKHVVLCPYCIADGIKTPISKYDVFCNRCGHKLDIDKSVFE